MKKEEMVYRILAEEAKGTFRLETEMNVSDAEAEIASILHAESVALVSRTDVQKGSVTVYGETIFRVLYQNADGDVRLLTEKVPFSETVNVKIYDVDTEVVAKAKVCCTDAKQINGRKVMAKSAGDITLCVYASKEQSVVTDVEEDGIEQKRQAISFMQPCGKYQKQFEIREQVEIANENPSVYEILRVDGKIIADGYKVVNQKVVVNAVLNAVILYVDDEMYQLCTASLSIPFTEIFEVENSEDDWYLLQNMTVENILFEVEADEKSRMRLVHLTCVADYTAEMYRPVTLSLVTDCYGIGKKAEIQNEKLTVYWDKGELNGQTGLKGQIEIGDNPKVGQVYYLQAEPKVESANIGDGVCQVRGVAEISVYYITEDEESRLGVLRKEVPFSEDFACDAEQAEAVLLVKASGVSYTRNGDYVIDIRGNILFEGKVLRKETLTTISDVMVREKEENTDLPSVTICFAQDGEGLWEVAKRYSTSMKAIMEENGVTENSNLSGKRLIVPKHR